MFFNRFVLNDAPEAWGYVFQDPGSPIARGIQDLHHDIFFFILVIMIFVFWLLFRTIWFFRKERNPKPSMIVHGTFLEIVWTVVPSLILLVLAYPSFALLYSMDELVSPSVTLKITGNQWYWSYEYSDYSTNEDNSIAFDSYMIPEDDLIKGALRLLEVDNRVVLPIETHIRLLITGRDVIHSWAVPSLGVKCDGIPGRLNQTSVFIDRPGVYHGQCSEICGAHHGYMPIVVEGVTPDEYNNWIGSQLDIELVTPEKTEIVVESKESNESAVLEPVAQAAGTPLTEERYLYLEAQKAAAQEAAFNKKLFEMEQRLIVLIGTMNDAFTKR